MEQKKIGKQTERRTREEGSGAGKRGGQGKGRHVNCTSRVSHLGGGSDTPESTGPTGSSCFSLPGAKSRAVGRAMVQTAPRRGHGWPWVWY